MDKRNRLMQHPYRNTRCTPELHPDHHLAGPISLLVHVSHTQAMQLYTNAMVSFLKANMSCNDQGIHIYMLHKLVLKGRTRFKWVRGVAMPG